MSDFLVVMLRRFRRVRGMRIDDELVFRDRKWPGEQWKSTDESIFQIFESRDWPLLLFSILCLDGIENELGIFRVGIILIYIYYVEYSILDFFLNMREKV